MRVKGKYELEIHLLALVGSTVMLEVLSWSSITSAGSWLGQAGLELAPGCGGPVGLSTACAPHCVTMAQVTPPRGCGRGSASRLKICMFLISCYGWKDHAKLLSPERAYLSFQAGVQLLGHIVSN